MIQCAERGPNFCFARRITSYWYELNLVNEARTHSTIFILNWSSRRLSWIQTLEMQLSGRSFVWKYLTNERTFVYISIQRSVFFSCTIFYRMIDIPSQTLFIQKTNDFPCFSTHKCSDEQTLPSMFILIFELFIITYQIDLFCLLFFCWQNVQYFVAEIVKSLFFYFVFGL